MKTNFTLHNDDCLNVLKAMKDNSIDSCVTDPPYGLSFMSKAWDYDVPKTEIWGEVLRVLKPGGHLLSFFGSRTYHRGAIQIEDAGFEIRDQIMWIYGSGFPKSLNVSKAIDKEAGAKRKVVGVSSVTGNRNSAFSVTRQDSPSGVFGEGKVNYVTAASTEEAKQWEGWGTALKPAHEPIVVARKPITQSVAKNVLEYGTGALNIDGCRVGNEERTYSLKGGENLNKLARPDGNDDVDAKSCGAYDIGAKQISIGETTVNGRWPANLIHDGSDEVVNGFPQTGSRNNKKPYSYAGREYDNKDTSMFNGDKPQAPSNYNDNGGASRFFYCAKASKTDRGENNNHPTVKPTELMKYLCRLVTPKDGIVLDPFMGSGTTGKAALQEGFRFVGVEMSKEYFEIAEARIKSAYEKDATLEAFFPGWTG
jgi:DNA modification methylase